MSRVLRISIHKWRKTKSVLMEGESAVFYIENNRICNKRLKLEFELFEKKIRVNSQNAKKRWEVNSPKPLKNNETGYATAMQPQCHTDTDTDTEEYKEKIYKKEKKKAVQVSDDFQPNSKHLEIAKEEKLDVQKERDAFVDHFKANGKKMIEWDRAFNNWLRNANKFNPRGKNHGSHQKPLNAMQRLQKTIDDNRRNRLEDPEDTGLFDGVI